MSKFFVNHNQIKDDNIYVVGDDVNHIKNVLRLRKDDKIIICDIQESQSYICKIEKLENKEVLCKIIEKNTVSTETKIDIHIFQGLPKSDKMEYIIQKTTELGVKQITPVQMKNCVKKLEQKDRKKKIERWQKIAEVAAKQSKRDMIPIVNDIIDIKSIPIEEYDIFIVAYEKENIKTLKHALQEKPNKIGVLIGPEGGISEEEILYLQSKKAICITLGQRILRTETAPIALTSCIVYELEM